MSRSRTLKEHASELDRLKKLLCEEELKTLEALQSALAQLETEVHSEDAVVQKITPLFDTILAQRLQDDSSRTIPLLADAIAPILQLTAQKHPEALSRALQGVVSEAISKEIEKNRTKIIDALYPIIGSMITKYVTQSIKELTEKINKKIENSLSIERYKRKLKAKMTGVSETELLLQESSDAKLQALFIIHKESGLLISEAQRSEKEIDDPLMVASMASAIKDFINDWIERQQEQKSEVQILSYGDAALYIESAGTVYLIAFFDAEPKFEQRQEINRFFADILTRYRLLFQSFSGQYDTPQLQQLSAEIADYLHQSSLESAHPITQPTETLNLRKIAIGVLLGALLLYSGFSLLGRLERSSALAYKVRQETGVPVSVTDHGDYLLLKGTIHSLEDAIRIRKMLEQESGLPVHNALQIPAEDLAEQILQITEDHQHTLRALQGQHSEKRQKAGSP